MSMSHVSVCLCVSSRKLCFRVDWSPLVKDCIANIGISLDIFGTLLFRWFSGLWLLDLVTGNMRHATHDMWHMALDMWYLSRNMWHITYFLFLFFTFCLFWYLWYYPHTSRHLVSPVCRFFLLPQIKLRCLLRALDFQHVNWAPWTIYNPKVSSPMQP